MIGAIRLSALPYDTIIPQPVQSVLESSAHFQIKGGRLITRSSGPLSFPFLGRTKVLGFRVLKLGFEGVSSLNESSMAFIASKNNAVRPEIP